MMRSISIGVIGLIAFGLLSATRPAHSDQPVMTNMTPGTNDTMTAGTPTFIGFPPISSQLIKHPTLILAEQRLEDLNRDVSFELYQPGRLWHAAVRKYAVGKPVRVQYFLRNNGDKPYAVEFRGHDYLGHFSFCIRASHCGEPLSPNPSNEDWYCPAIYSSNLYFYMAGDIIILYPGEMTSRVIELDKLLARACGFRAGLPMGTYTIQLSLGGLLSEEFVIEMVKE